MPCVAQNPKSEQALSSGTEHFAGGIAGFWDKLAAIDPQLTRATNPSSPLFRDWFEVLFCNTVVGVAIVCQPHIITRSLMLRDGKDVNKYLTVAIVVEILFFMVLFVGFFARLSFPDLAVNGQKLPLDGIIPAYVVNEFPVYAGLLVILGLISAGLSTLEGLIQSLSTTLTADLIDPLLGGRLGEGETRAKKLARINKLVIIALAVAAIFWSHQQLLNPKLSVGILAQNGVYAYFSAAFVPVLLGIYGKNVKPLAPIAASVTAIVVHFSVYYGQLTPYTTGPVRNPAVACTLAILAAFAVGLSIHFFNKKQTA